VWTFAGRTGVAGWVDLYSPASPGPDAGDPAEDVAVVPSGVWPGWERGVIERPTLTAVAAAAYLALAWLIGRAVRRRRPWFEAMVALVLALPLAPVCVLVARTPVVDRLAARSGPLAVPGWVAVSLSSFVLCALAAGALRVAARRGAPAPDGEGTP
jgi:hypothetical protein